MERLSAVTVRDWLERSKSAGMSLGLERAMTALESLGRPDKSLRCIHVAGSNGKGSSCAYLAASLIRSGHQVGLFTSPHVSRIEERIRINGRPITTEKFDEALSIVHSASDKLTFFEITFLAALVACRDAGCEYMILETGLGGRLDATRTAEVIGCLVTAISLEHSKILGATIEEIAKEKAAIARTGIPIIVKKPPENIQKAILEIAPHARFIAVDGNIHDEAQALARELLIELKLPWKEGPVHWPARMQKITGNPTILLDAAHNPSGIAKVMSQIITELPEKWLLIFGSSPQNDLENFLKPLISLIEKYHPQRVIFTEPRGGRYPPLSEFPLQGEWIRDPAKAIEIAKAEDCDLILVIGSLYLCGNILQYLGKDSDDDFDILSQSS